MFYVHTRSRITHYEYWFNGMDSLKRVVNVTPPQDTLSIITMLPVDTTLPLRSNSFLFDPNNGHPVIYARNRISLRFLTGDCRYVETHADYADVNIKDTVMADTLERSTTKQIVAPMNNAIHWFKLAVEAGDSMLFRADKPCTMQLFATSGKELFLETGDSVLHWINCIGEENGVYYLAVHDAEDTGQLSVSYRNGYQITVVSSDTTMGKVTGDGHYKNLTQVMISATPKYGYHFTQWNDGDTTNPRTVTLLGDTSFMASFAPNDYQLTVASSDTLKGGVTGGGSFAYLSQVKISATSNYGYHFTQWNDGDTTNPRVVTLKGDTSFTASFAVNNYNLAVVSSDTLKGGVTGGGSFAYLSQALISATPKYGYHFTQWNDGDTTNPRTVTLLGDTSFTASFAPNDYQLSVASSDTLKGGVTGGGSFAYLSQVKIFATSNYGYHFTHWNDSDTSNPRIVTLLGDTSFTASFAVNNYNLAVVSSDTLKGKVSGGGSFAYLSQALISATPKYGYHFTQWNDGDTTNPRLITMKGDTSFTATFSANSYKLAAISADTVNGMVSGGGSYTYLSQVKISATPKYGYHFTQWNDGDTTNPRVVTLKGDTTFIATFAPNDYLLTVTAGDTVRWIMTVSGSFAYMSKIKLTAASPYGYHFVQWNDGDTTNPRVITLTQDTMFFAMFAPNDYLLTVASSDEEMGVVEGGDTYSYLDTAILRAAAAEHHHFLHWSDGNRENPRMVTVLGDSSFTAVFAIDTHRLTVLSNDTAMGHVTEGGYYAYGTEVELTAVAADNHHFVRWDDGDTTNPRIVTVTEDMELTAYFEKNTGVKEPELPEGISIYGSDHHIIIKGAEGYEVKILNAIGQLIHRAVINEDVLRVRMPVKGVYFVKVGAFPPKKVLVY